jgi:hypothetical protein
MLQTLEFCNVLILQHLPKSYATLCTFVASDPNGIQFSYNPFATKELGRLEHADLIWQDGGATPLLRGEPLWYPV